MRDYLLLYLNGHRHEIRGESAFLSLSDFLRHELQSTGTKDVCNEGDCGACTVLVGRPCSGTLRYETVDACIQFLYQLDGKHVVTVEGLPDHDGMEIHPVQRALAECYGSQCGYCSPGFVMALAGMFESKATVGTHDLRTALTGNLCRCTGYVPILEAACAVDGANVPSLADCYGATDLADQLAQVAVMPVWIEARPSFAFFGPRTLQQAIDFKASHPEAAIVSGGTELGVVRNKLGLAPPILMSLAHVPGLADIACSEDSAVIGANVTWAQVEVFARHALPEFHRIVVRFGSPQIRNVATLVANVAHGSPTADSLPFLCVMDAELDLASQRGVRRVKVNSFYTGYKVKDLADDEIITHVRVPLPRESDLLKLYKVSRRNDLDIATFGAALRVHTAGDIITRAYLAYSGVAPTVVRLPRTESFLQGKAFAEDSFRAAGRLARTEIQPLSDVRGSRDYRLLLAENILTKFWFDCCTT